MYSLLRHFLLAMAILLCLWMPSIAETDINPKDHHGKTALMQAAQDGKADRVKELIAAGADVNAKDNDGDTALMFASNIDCVKTLIAAHAEVNAKDKDGKTALMSASTQSNTDSVMALVAAGADVKAKDKDGFTALMSAAAMGNTDCLKALIAAGADAKTKSNNGTTALMLAMTIVSADSVKTLMAAGAVFTKMKSSRMTKNMVVAAQAGNMKQVMALIATGADMNLQFNGGIPPLGETTSGWGTTVSLKYNPYVSVLTVAAYKGNVDCVKILIAVGANVSETDNVGRTALWWARNSPLKSNMNVADFDSIIAALKDAGTPE